MEKATRNTGALKSVLDHMTGNADRPVTLDEIHKETGVYVGTISGVCTRIMSKFPNNMERKAKGVYIWHSKAVDTKPETPVGKLMIVRILKVTNDRMLVIDDSDNSRVFTMKEVDW